MTEEGLLVYPIMKFFPPILTTLILTQAALSLQCSRTADVSDARKARLTVQIATEPVSLDPAMAEDGAALRILGNLMDGLVGYDGAGQLIPLLAESYQLSPDGKRYEFKLRSTARWSDGKPVTIQDFIFGLRRSLGPRSRSKLASTLFSIRGARAFHEGQIPAEQLGIEERNGRLVIETEYPAPTLIQALSLPVALPIREDILKKGTNAVHEENDWPETAPSTGAYRIAKHLPDQKLILEQNPYYHGGNDGIRTIELIVISDESTAMNLFEKGKIDILTKVHSIDLKRLREMQTLHTDPFYATYFLSFNVRKTPFNIREWRRAVASAIERDQIVQALDTGDLPASSWIPKGLEGFSPYQQESKVFDDAIVWAAKRQRDSPIRQVIAASFDTSNRNTMIMEKVQQDLVHAFRLRLSLQKLDWKSYIKMLQTDAPPLFRFGFQAPFMDPLTHLLAFTSTDPNNYTGWKHKKYDRLVSEIERMPPGKAREAKIIRAQKILTEEEAIVIPIFHYVQHHAVSKRVRNFRVNALGLARYGEFRLNDP